MQFIKLGFKNVALLFLILNSYVHCGGKKCTDSPSSTGTQLPNTVFEQTLSPKIGFHTISSKHTRKRTLTEISVTKSVIIHQEGVVIDTKKTKFTSTVLSTEQLQKILQDGKKSKSRSNSIKRLGSIGSPDQSQIFGVFSRCQSTLHTVKEAWKVTVVENKTVVQEQVNAQPAKPVASTNHQNCSCIIL